MSTPNATTIIIKSIAPVSFLIICFEGAMKMKFSCPCSAWWNQVTALFMLIVPAFFAWLMMSLFVRFQEQNNSGEPGNNEKLRDFIKFIPTALWICVFFIDGDYVTCLFTTDEHNFCDSNQGLNCLSWCKPDGRDQKRFTISHISKVLGYALALLGCLSLFFVHYVKLHCCNTRTTTQTANGA